MSLLTRFLKALKPAPPKPPPARVASVFAPAYPAAGWWHDDPAEQLRNYRSWVYAAVNAIAQEAARHRPFLYRNTGQAEHEQTALAHTHPLCRLLDHPNPWLTPWELWYLTVVYLELTGNNLAISYVTADASHRGHVMGSTLVALNGAEVWAYVVELDDGLRVRFALDDWLRMNLGPGQRVPVRLPGKPDAWLFVTHVTELPPIVWVMLATRVRMAG